LAEGLKKEKGVKQTDGTAQGGDPAVVEIVIEKKSKGCGWLEKNITQCEPREGVLMSPKAQGLMK